MAMRKTMTAMLVGSAMVAQLAGVPATAEAVRYGEGYRVDQDATNGAFDGVRIAPARTTDLTYAHPYSVPGQLNTRLTTDVWMNGELVDLSKNTTVTHSNSGGADVVTLVTSSGSTTVTRTFTIIGRKAEVVTVIKGTPGASVQLDSTVRLDGLENGYTGTYDDGARTFHLTPKLPGYEVDVTFGDGLYAVAAEGDWEALDAGTTVRGAVSVSELSLIHISEPTRRS